METNGASPKRGVLVYQDVSSDFGRKLGCRNVVNYCAPVKTVGERKDEGFSFERNREGAAIISADRDARPGRQGERHNRSAHCLSGRLYAWH